MILYEGGEDILTKKNTSRVYCDGSIHKTNNCGIITVIAQENRYYPSYKNGNEWKSYQYFIVKFVDGTQMQAQMTNIREGDVKNSNKPCVFNKGFLGQGIYSSISHPKEYRLWKNMLKRCYSEEYHKRKPSYKGCLVANRWLNFQLFCTDLLSLVGYILWKQDDTKRNLYELDKDIKVKGNKLYSKYTTQFVLQKENASECNKRTKITGLTYVAHRIADKYKEEFSNQREFASKYNLQQVGVNKCCTGSQISTGGWKIEIKEEAL